MVYTRLLEKSAPPNGKIRKKIIERSIVKSIVCFSADRIIPDLIPEGTRETARNWFYKIAIIRELVPRILVEAAILKCYSFISTEYEQIDFLPLTFPFFLVIINPLWNN